MAKPRIKPFEIIFSDGKYLMWVPFGTVMYDNACCDLKQPYEKDDQFYVLDKIYDDMYGHIKYEDEKNNGESIPIVEFNDNELLSEGEVAIFIVGYITSGTGDPNDAFYNVCNGAICLTGGSIKIADAPIGEGKKIITDIKYDSKTHQIMVKKRWMTISGDCVKAISEEDDWTQMSGGNCVPHESL